MELTGKVAFITGSANGLGKGYAEALLEKGVKVFISDVDENAGAATLAEFVGKFGSKNVRFAKLDVTNENNFKDVFQEAIHVFGRIDIMVNNAGILHESDWQRMVDVNLFGVIRGTKLAEDHMRKDKGGKGGRIINISSVAGLGDYTVIAIYGATKHAVRSFTMSQAQQFDLEARGLEYAVICPCPADTDIIRKANEDKVNFYYSGGKEFLEATMPISRVVDAFSMLVQLDRLNGAIVLVTGQEVKFQKIEAVDLGKSYQPAF